MKKKNNVSAFSLIELMIAITIITLLCAVLLPGVRGARRLASETACQANLGQIDKAWQMYLNEYNGSFYQGINANLNYGGWIGRWSLLNRPLNPFVNLPLTVDNPSDAGLFRCPSDNGGVPGKALTAFEEFGTSYQTNLLLIGQTQIPKGSGNLAILNTEINKRLKRMSVNRAAAPAKLFLIGDYGWINQWYPKVPYKTEWHDVPAHHNLAFLDGHVDFVHVRKGIYVAPDYHVLPFEDLFELAASLQVEDP